MEVPGLANAFRRELSRDLKLTWRRWGQAVNPLMFFVMVTTLFPLALSPDPSQLRDAAAGVLWVAALLSSLLALETLFKSDFEDGSIEQLVLSPQPLTLMLLAKTAAHWLVSGLPLVVLSPLVAVGLNVPTEALGTLALALALGTPTLSLIGAAGAALTVGLRRGGVLLSLLVLPLAMPILIFGARATDMAIREDVSAGPLYLLAALLLFALSLAPFATSAALRISMD